MNAAIKIVIYAYIGTLMMLFLSIDSANCSFPVKYPGYLTLTCNKFNKNVIDFLDLKILLHKNKKIIDIYYKCKDFSFQVNTFTSFNFWFHLSVYRIILLKYLLRIKNECSSSYKVPNVKRLIYIAIIHGYPKPFICSIIYN